MLTTSNSASPDSCRESVKYRTSCDRCQNLKLRCSQEKPTCKRCLRKGIDCVYSPLRRIGRPRKLIQQAVAEINLEERAIIPVTASSTSASISVSDSHQGYSDSQTTDFTVDSVASVITSTNDNLEDWNYVNRSLPSAIASNHAPSDNYQTGYPPQTDYIPSLPLHPTFTNSLLSQNVPNHLHDCYTAILARTTKLEQSLLLQPRAPPIDLVLEAERDLRILHNRLTNCTGHAHTSQNCRISNRANTLSLSLFAERVVSMLEQTFRTAAETASAPNPAIQDPSGIQLPAPAARRLERSFRGLLDLPCVFPIPAANFDTRVGDHVVDGPVKARSVKRILQLRVQKLLVVLEEMQKASQVRDRNNGSSSHPLDWGGSAAVMNNAASLLIEDLIRRMETLEGGMVLMG